MGKPKDNRSASAKALDHLLASELEADRALADKLRAAVHRSSLWRYRAGLRDPRLAEAKRIETLTDGRVPMGGWA